VQVTLTYEGCGYKAIEIIKIMEILMKQKQKSNEKSNPIINGMVSTFFDVVKHFIKDMDNSRKLKNIDRYSEKFSTLEHMMLRLEKKLDENRHQIEDLKTRLLWGNIIIIVLILVNLFQLIG
jgi:flagellar motility protein MotE (MotC chaperone)